MSVTMAQDNIVIFPPPRRGETADRHPADVLTERLAAQLAGEDAVICADALTRLLAAVACCNAINRTEAVETAQAIAGDLESLVEEMMRERACG